MTTTNGHPIPNPKPGDLTPAVRPVKRTLYVEEEDNGLTNVWEATDEDLAALGWCKGHDHEAEVEASEERANSFARELNAAKPLIDAVRRYEVFTDKGVTLALAHYDEVRAKEDARWLADNPKAAEALVGTTPSGEAETMGEAFARAVETKTPMYVGGYVYKPEWYDASTTKPRPYVTVLLWFPQLVGSLPVMCGHWDGHRYHACGLDPESKEQPSHWAAAPSGPGKEEAVRMVGAEGADKVIRLAETVSGEPLCATFRTVGEERAEVERGKLPSERVRELAALRRGRIGEPVFDDRVLSDVLQVLDERLGRGT